MRPPYHTQVRWALHFVGLPGWQDWQLTVLDDNALRKKARSTVVVQTPLYNEVLGKLQKNHCCACTVQDFAVGEDSLGAVLGRDPDSWSEKG